MLQNININMNDIPLNTTNKLHTIKQFVRGDRFNYVPIDPLAINCLYDLYLLINNATPQSVIQDIGLYKIPSLDIDVLSQVYYYIGYFCETILGKRLYGYDPVFELSKGIPPVGFVHKVSKCYYKLSVELGNCYGMEKLGYNYFLKDDIAVNYKRALKYYKSSLYCHNKKHIIYFRMAEVYHRNSNYDKAITYFKIAIAYHRDDDDDYKYHEKSHFHYRLAETYKLKMDNSNAMFHYKAATLRENKCNNPGEMYYNIGLIYDDQEDLKNALVNYKLALDNRYSMPNNIYFNMCRIFEQTKDWANLEYFCGILIKNNYKKRNILYLSMANLYINMELYDKTIEYCGRAIEADYNVKGMAYNMMGHAYFKKEDYDKANEYYKKSLDGCYYLAARGLAITYWNMGNYTEALKYIEINIEFYRQGLIDNLFDKFEWMITSVANRDVLIKFYVTMKNSGRLLELHNNNLKFGCTTTREVVELLGDIPKPDIGTSNKQTTFLQYFVSSIIRPKITVLDLHFKYTINAEGYEQAKTDYMFRTANANIQGIDLASVKR